MDSAIPLTKFRVPRLRGDTVPRAALLTRLLASVDAHPVTLVCAPGGSGKTVLLSQLAASLPGKDRALWVALDRDDNDANRLFAALVRAVEPLALTWEVDPGSLVTGVAAGRAQARAALAALVNALCTTATERVILVLDDLHRLDNIEAYALLDALIERLPDHVAVVLGTRTEPPLSLARWRAHGELGEFRAADLRFAVDDARALAARKTGGEADDSLVDRALARSDGWAVGLSMLLRPTAGPNTGESSGGADSRHLFAYLAQEVLAELPAELGHFALRSSILDELNPELCRAITQRDDSAALLRDLYRRNLFVTAIDESLPVLRFHDLFRDFLQAELKRRWPDELSDLHLRAAQAEEVPARSIAHFIAARAWGHALGCIAAVGEDLLAEGAIASIERWLEQIPESFRASNPHVAFLNGALGWLAWDWVRAERHLPVAVVGLTAPHEQPRRVRALFQLVDALASAGNIDGARRQLDDVARLPLDDLGNAQLALQRAWCLTHSGEVDESAANMQRFVEYVARDPQRICPVTAELVHCVLVGRPGVTAAFERFVALAEDVRESIGRPWHLPLFAVDGWARVWRGDRAGADAALARANMLFKQFRGIRLMSERIRQFRILYIGAIGDLASIDAAAQEMIGGLGSRELAAHRAAWERAYRHGHARLHWIHGNYPQWSKLVAPLAQSRTPVEWPFVELAAQVVRGQQAIVANEWRTAISALEPTLAGYARFCMPMVYCDPRVSLAYAQLRAGEKDQAWRTFEPVYCDATDAGAPGILLLDSRSAVNELLQIAPPATRGSASLQSLHRLLGEWSASGKAQTANSGAGAAVGPLSEREREVLELVASGASNKHIARQLDLSLHTVKRHICNILDKLDCDSRGQAADWFRRAPATAG